VEVKTMSTRALRILTLSFMALAPAAVHAGPPLLCFPMSIGDAPSLPWGDGGAGWNQPRHDYERARLTEDALALLGPKTPVLVRMETLRRATIYASSDPGAATRLLDALRTRAGDPRSGRSDPLALFDLGYAVEASRETGHVLARSSPQAPEDGYALVREALARRGEDPAMEYAAALMTCTRAFSGVASKHLRAAVSGAGEESDLARTIAGHRPLWGEQLDAARATASR
jgi:hypothetical protein